MKLMITGHRPQKLWGFGNDPRYAALRKRMEQYILNVGAKEVITGMALGADLIFAEAALNIRMKHPKALKLVCAIPCADHSSKWNLTLQKRYSAILRLANEIVQVSDKPYSPGCMQLRNEYMVKRCDRVLALWDGSAGGTGNCVAFAKKIGKPVKIVDPAIITL